MKLIITSWIKEAEFEPIQDIFNLEIVKMAAQKSIQGLGQTIKSSSKIAGTQLKKLYLTSSGGAGRVIFLLKINNQKAVSVMLRAKNDKQIGSNMTIQNPQFKKALDENLDRILEDLETGNYEEISL